MSQGLVQVLEAAALLRADKSLRFVFIGDGAEKQALRQTAAQRQLDNVEFHPPLPFEQMPGVIDAADIGVVPLKALTAFATTLPSKLFEFMAMAKPVALAVASWRRRSPSSPATRSCAPRWARAAHRRGALLAPAHRHRSRVDLAGSLA